MAIKQWQKLPSKILSELCKKDGKGVPFYTSVKGRGGGDADGGAGAGGGSHRYKVIIPATNKKSNTNDNDVVLTPSLSVSNEEQAKEEAALLGLLYLFPKLPHERTLPEPYRATFLAALKNTQGGGGAGDVEKSGEKTSGNSKSDSKSTIPTSFPAAATANTQLTANLPSFHKASTITSTPILTKAQMNEVRKQHQREVQARIRKHEAIRNANKPMEVFMSATFRRRIERLLTGDGSNMEDDDRDDDEEVLDENGGDDDEDVVKSYVMQRLIHEGFTSSQVRKAYKAVYPNSNASIDENQDDQLMDKAYEEILQYLCIHLKEDQLPLGFDPRGGTLDVVRPVSKKFGEIGSGVGGTNNNGKDKDGGAANDEGYDANIVQFANQFGLDPKEAIAVLSFEGKHEGVPLSSLPQTKEFQRQYKLWNALMETVSLPVERMCFFCNVSDEMSDEERERNEEASANECEALEAIFDSEEFSIRRLESTTTISIDLPFGDCTLFLEVHYSQGSYPDLLPMVFLTTGDATQATKYRFGGNLHLKMIRFLSEITPGQECIFELFGYVQSLLQEEEEQSSLDNTSALLAKFGDSTRTKANRMQQGKQTTKDGDRLSVPVAFIPSQPRSKPHPRPCERSAFWNTPPHKTPPTEASPKLPSLLDRARKNLPAAKAKDEFLSLMKRANAKGHVVLVTGGKRPT